MIIRLFSICLALTLPSLTVVAQPKPADGKAEKKDRDAEKKEKKDGEEKQDKKGDGTASGATTPSPVSYWRQVRPIFQKNCQGCHQPAKRGGKLALTTYTEITKGRSEDPVVVPGKPDESLLYQEIIPEEGDPPSMPKKRDPLAEADVELIRRWIAGGAEDDSPESAGQALVTSENPPVYETPPVLTSLDYSPDGSLLAVSGYHEVLLHEADGSALVARLVGLSERIESAVFSPDGKYLAVTGGLPGRLGELQIWNVEKRKLSLSVPVTFDTVYGACWSPDGKLIAFGCSDNTLRAVEAKSGRQVLYQGAHNDWVLDTVFSTDASHLISVSRDRSMKLTKVETEQFIDNITSITPGALKGGLITVDRHPKKDELLVAGADGQPKIFRMYREKARKIGDDYNLIRKFEAMPGRVYSARFSTDGGRILSGSSLDGTGEARAYNTADGKLLWSVKLPSGVYTVAFSPDGKRAAVGGFDGAVRLLDGEKGTVVKKFIPVPLSL